MLSFPYAVSGYRVARLVADVNIDGGILICGIGVRISLAANGEGHSHLRLQLPLYGPVVQAA